MKNVGIYLGEDTLALIRDRGNARQRSATIELIVQRYAALCDRVRPPLESPRDWQTLYEALRTHRGIDPELLPAMFRSSPSAPAELVALIPRLEAIGPAGRLAVVDAVERHWSGEGK